MFDVIKLPQLTTDMQEATAVACPVKPGNEVKKGDVVFEIETDKATVELESPYAGFVKAIAVSVGQSVKVDDVLMVLGERDSQLTDEEFTSLIGNSSKCVASVRDDNFQHGSSKQLCEADITESFCRQSDKGETVYKLGQKVIPNRLSKITAEKMLRSKREIPCFYLNVTVNAARLVSARADANRAGDVKISYNDFVMQALAAGIEKYPIMSGQLCSDSIVLADSIGIGLAINTPAGLVAPIVKDVEKKSVQQISSASKALIERAMAGKLAPSDFAGGCITLSNLGAFGIDSFIPIVVPGQCSILGVGKISDTCVPDGDKLAVGKAVKLTLSVDHRIANGAEAARFLDFVARQLESF